jgi:DNA-binding transcriptional LysR family regulator
VQLQDLGTFVTVATERSFSVAAKKLHRTQPAVSQAIRRLEEELGDRLFDRSVRNGALTEAGRLLLDYATRLLTLATDAEVAVRELQQVRRGRVIIGANEAAVHSLLPYLDRFAKAHPQALVEVRRVRSRAIAADLLNRSLDFGVLTFQPADRGLQSLALGGDELVMLTHPSHPLAARRRATIEEVGQQTVIAHNDPSPARERVLRAYERRHTPINIQVALPSLDGIKRAVEMGIGVAVLPRRCALSEIANGQLVAIKVPGLSTRRQVRLVYRRGDQSHAAEAFLEIVRATAGAGDGDIAPPTALPQP